MTELDFDELDKAVNSLMAENDTPATGDQVQGGAATPQPTTDATTPAAVAAPAARRGRFMDIVAPKSSVRTTPIAVKREAADITPPVVEEAVTPDTTAIEAETEVPELTPVTSEIADEQQATPVPPEATPESEEVADDPSVTIPDIAPESEGAPVETPAPLDTPQSSPFLPDAKVEKRPLGGDDIPPAEVSIPEEPVEPQSAQEESSDMPGESEEAPDATSDVGSPEPAPMPDELHEDVVAVESQEMMPDDTPTPESAVESPSAPEAEVDTSAPVSGSITQQYAEQPSSGDQTNGAIYDTSTYHQPLEAASPKKKSAVLTWILWTLVLLILGATAGAAWFYFTTQ